jgi:hypothetical protein
VRQDRRTAFFTICAEREDCCTDRNEIAAGRAGGEYPVEERCNGLLGGLAQRLGVIVLGLAPVSLSCCSMAGSPCSSWATASCFASQFASAAAPDAKSADGWTKRSSANCATNAARVSLTRGGRRQSPASHGGGRTRCDSRYYRGYPGVGHGVGTSAEGWIDEAIRFWGRHQSR